MSAEASTTRRSLVPEPLTEAGWSPFGWLPVADVDPQLPINWAVKHVPAILERRDNPQDDLISELIEVHDEQDGRLAAAQCCQDLLEEGVHI